MQQNEVSIQERFERFHGENPQVYRAIHWSVMDLELQGHKHYSIDAILHVIRYDRNITTTGRNFKINNDFTSRYARKFMDEFPAYRGFFQLRELKS